MGNSRRPFGDLRGWIWESGAIKWRVFGNVGEWTWGTLVHRASGGPIGRTSSHLNLLHRPCFPKGLTVVPATMAPCRAHSTKTLTIVLAHSRRILLIHRFSIHLPKFDE